MPGFQSFFSCFLHHFVSAKLATSSIRVNASQLLCYLPSYMLAPDLLSGSVCRSQIYSGDTCVTVAALATPGVASASSVIALCRPSKQGFTSEHTPHITRQFH